MEEALTLTSIAYPFSVTCVLYIENLPSADLFRKALDVLQSRHPLLQCSIIKEKNKYFFKNDVPKLPIELTIIQRKNESLWRTRVELLLNEGFPSQGPLIKCEYVGNRAGDIGEFIICMHHAIIDGLSARVILHEVLCLVSGKALDAPKLFSTAAKLPDKYTGLKLLGKIISFLPEFAKREFKLKTKGLKFPIPANSYNKTIEIKLSVHETRKIVLKCLKKNISLNSILLSVMAIALIQFCLKHTSGNRLRLISFTNLRHHLIPLPDANELGSYISLLPLDIDFSNSMEIFAKRIHKAIFGAGKKSEPLIMFKLTSLMMKWILRIKHWRMGTTALSFIGNLDLLKDYAGLKLNSVSAFIPTNKQSPGFTGFGKILFDELSLDFAYLESEISSETAAQIVKFIHQKLLLFGNSA